MMQEAQSVKKYDKHMSRLSNGIHKLFKNNGGYLPEKQVEFSDWLTLFSLTNQGPGSISVNPLVALPLAFGSGRATRGLTNT